MKVLLTGASSFTGLWFARALAQAGHEITAALPRSLAAYAEGVRAKRVCHLRGLVRIVDSCEFGGDRFIDTLRSGAFDVLCHHAARVQNYRSLDFDVAGALAENVFNLPAVLQIGSANGLGAVILTGTVFEPSEGAGTEPRLAFSPYALSKGATASVVQFWCAQLNLKLAKFVIPNPFGPFEEPRFCDYLVQCWANRKTAVVKTPAYIRDNIHVSLLAQRYGDLVKSLPSLPTYSHHAPSGYVETQGAFAMRFGFEIGQRLGIECPLEFLAQTKFTEPMVRINTSPCDHAQLGWQEADAWSELADYYRSVYLAAAGRHASAKGGS